MDTMDRQSTPPFALRLFYRTGAFHRPDEFTTDPLPPHLLIHTWPSCTLTELSHYLLSASPSILPETAIGTRLVFRLIYPRADPSSQNLSIGRFQIKELGSIVIGDGGKGLDPENLEVEKTLEPDNAQKTLADARILTGDYVSVAILPTLDDGSVAPASSARMGRGTGAGEALATVGRAPEAAGRERQNGYPKEYGRSRGGWSLGGFGRGGVPTGEWRRGERLPDPPPPGRGRRY